MRKSFSFFRAGLFSISLFLTPLNILSQTFITKPLQKCGFLKTETLREIKVASDNVEKLYIPLPEGLIKAVDSKKLETIWQSDVGGEIDGLYISGNSNLLVGTLTNKSDEVKRNENEKGIAPAVTTLSIQSLSSTTGITQWKKQFNVSSGTKRVYLLSDSKLPYVFVLSEKGNFLILNKESGEIKNEKNLNTTINLPVLAADNKIYFGSSDNKILAVSAAVDYTELNITETAKLSNQATILLASENGYLFAGDKTGIVYALQTNNKKIKWKARSGAEITSIKEIADRLLVASSDNYIYFLSKNTGSRIWKKRLEGKIQGDLPIDSDSAIASPFGTNTATVFDLKKGKTVNSLTVGANLENSFTDNPLIIGSSVIFSTVDGLYSYSAENCAEKK